MKSIPRGATYYRTVGCIETSIQEPFYAGEADDLPRSSMGTFYLDLRPEAGYTFSPFWESICMTTLWQTATKTQKGGAQRTVGSSLCAMIKQEASRPDSSAV